MARGVFGVLSESVRTPDMSRDERYVVALARYPGALPEPMTTEERSVRSRSSAGRPVASLPLRRAIRAYGTHRQGKGDSRAVVTGEGLCLTPTVFGPRSLTRAARRDSGIHVFVHSPSFWLPNQNMDGNAKVNRLDRVPRTRRQGGKGRELCQGKHSSTHDQVPGDQDR